jgi:hypothetical protein
MIMIYTSESAILSPTYPYLYLQRLNEQFDMGLMFPEPSPCRKNNEGGGQKAYLNGCSDGKFADFSLSILLLQFISPFLSQT